MVRILIPHDEAAEDLIANLRGTMFPRGLYFNVLFFLLSMCNKKKKSKSRMG